MVYHSANREYILRRGSSRLILVGSAGSLSAGSMYCDAALLTVACVCGLVQEPAGVEGRHHLRDHHAGGHRRPLLQVTYGKPLLGICMVRPTSLAYCLPSLSTLGQRL
jgi:hypothetical protein